MIEGYKDDFKEVITERESYCLLKWLKLTGVDDSERPGVPLISHPAILPMYVFAYDHKFYDSIPKNFKMNLFQRYMEEESKIGKQLLQLKNSIYFNLNFFKFSNLYSFKTK